MAANLTHLSQWIAELICIQMHLPLGFLGVLLCFGECALSILQTAPDRPLGLMRERRDNFTSLKSSILKFPSKRGSANRQSTSVGFHAFDQIYIWAWIVSYKLC